MTIYEQFGRLTETYEAECMEHRKTVGVLRALKQGDLSLDALTVTDDNKWSIEPDQVLEETPVVSEHAAGN